MPRDRLPFLLLPIAALLAVLPLILHGCSCGHDFDFHILSWMEAARQFTHGNLHPHWAFTPAYNAGEPRFVFYPPFSWTLGALLGLLLPWTATPIVYTWLALTACGLSLYSLARDFTTPTAALLAATFYAVNPYMLFTAYERTAYAELLAAAWIPLLLHAILRRQITIPRIAIPVALLWITNAPAAVMASYTLALLALLRLAHPLLQARKADSLLASAHSDHPASHFNARTSILPDASRIFAGTALGLGLSAFYLLPAAYERRYVQIAMAIIPNMRIQDNFLFHHTGDIPHDLVLRTASVLALILLTLTAVAFCLALLRHNTQEPAARKNPPEKPSSRPKRSEVESPLHLSDPAATPCPPPTPRLLFFSIATLTVTIALLLTPLTSLIWSHLPELSFLQFPWRLLAILAAVLSLTTAFTLSPLKLKPAPTIVLSILTAAALTYPAYALFHQPCDQEDTVQARQALFRTNQGSDPTDEYTPITADNDSLGHASPGFWLSPNPNAKAPVANAPGPAPTQLTIDSPIPQTLILNLRDYPAWRITQNGALITARESRDDGLLAIPLPAGSSTLAITYTRLPDQILGDLISGISIGLLLISFRRKLPPEPQTPQQDR
jgi:hypothetical protein